MRVFIVVISVVVGVTLLGRTLFLVIMGSGQFTDFETVLADQCDKIEIAPGPEDIQIDHQTGLAYIAATDRRDLDNGRRVGVYVLNLNTPDKPARQLEGEFPKGFAPHGIHLWRGKNGERRLFVVNHPHNGHSVEIFSLGENDYLTHLDTITSELFTNPNDIVGVGPEQFYVTNMQTAASGALLTLELYLGLPVTNVMHYDGKQVSLAAGGLITANGVNISDDGKKLYVAEAVARRVNIFDRDPNTGVLSKRREIPVNTSPDNIDVAQDGALFVGSHPDILAFVKHSKDPTAISPSHVIKVDPVSGDYETVFMSIKGEIDGSSVGPYWQGNLLVGGVFESHIMWCKDFKNAG